MAIRERAMPAQRSASDAPDWRDQANDFIIGRPRVGREVADFRAGEVLGPGAQQRRHVGGRYRLGRKWRND
jgi:hypothetical protein